MSSLFKPRTVISFMLYGTFCYLCIKGVISEDAIVAVISALMTFYYTQKIGEKNNVGKNISNSSG